jgi:hypothetical protein
MLHQSLSLAQTLASELKATLQLLQVVMDRPRRRQGKLLNTDLPIYPIQGNLVGQVSKLLQPDDLLMMTAGTQPERFGTSALGVEPEAIARQHPEVSMIIVHFPSQTE